MVGIDLREKFAAIDEQILGLRHILPAAHLGLRANGERAWFGWPTDEKVEELKEKFIDAADAEAQKAVAEEIQAHAMDNGLLIPLGQYTLPQARRAGITEMINSPVPVFWNLQKAE